jgi:chromosome segregation ATPase|tara:strand:+ start:888 stop:1166 length:279 start_codon:yes stop_codon:yes gene_type:complete
MADDIKFTEEEMKSLGDLQDSYTKKQAELGQVSVQRILLNQQLDNLDQRQSHLEKEYVQVQQQERDLVKELNEKYGAGQLDPESGVFTPNNS